MQEYLRSTINRLAAAPALASRLRVRAADLRNAVAATFDELCASESRIKFATEARVPARLPVSDATC